MSERGGWWRDVGCGNERGNARGHRWKAATFGLSLLMTAPVPQQGRWASLCPRVTAHLLWLPRTAHPRGPHQVWRFSPFVAMAFLTRLPQHPEQADGTQEGPCRVYPGFGCQCSLSRCRQARWAHAFGFPSDPILISPRPP